VEFPLDQTVCDRFEAQVAPHAGRIAVASAVAELTYAALDVAANRLGHAILRHRPGRDEPVALFFEPGAGEIVAVLGALKAGRPYMPLPPSAPPAALARMLEDSTAGLLLTSATALPRVRDRLPAGVAALSLEALEPDLPATAPAVPRTPGGLAAIIYTSGSTGTPKGVMQTHRILLHRAREFTEDCAGLGPGDRVALLVSCSFSASLRLVFGALLNGATLCPFDVAGEGVGALAAWLSREQITVYYSVPSVFRRLAAALGGRAELPALRRARVGGEPLTAADVELYRQGFPPHCVLTSALSSSEAGTIARWLVDHTRSVEGPIVPAGHPGADKEVFLLDEAGAPVAPGEVGEIAVRSPYLSPGYWRRPDLTAAAFMADPQGGAARVYRTGDLGRLRPDGCLEHLGRRDFSVKVRGQRVDLGEVERALVDLGVGEAVVVGREDGAGDVRLVAYVTAGEDPAPDPGRLRHGLGARLPAHMIPSVFVGLDALPRSANGKVDRQALPRPDPVRPELQTPFVAPRTPVEEAVARIWATALGVERVGIHDHFLDLGGHSLLASQIVSQVMGRFAVDVPARELFESPTVAAMAVLVVQRLAAQAGDDEMARLWTGLSA
jgi:amino acid adenylation domain-containing protein